MRPKATVTLHPEANYLHWRGIVRIGNIVRNYRVKARTFDEARAAVAIATGLPLDRPAWRERGGRFEAWTATVRVPRAAPIERSE